METKLIARVNNVDIVSTSDEQMVAIKPICEALGIDRKSQQEKVKEHPIYSSVGVLKPLTGSDGKVYEMLCLPIEFIFGWLFSINPNNVKEEAREALIKYQFECNHALYTYFYGGQKKLLEQNKIEISLLEDIDDIKQSIQTSKSELSKKQKLLEQIRQERLKNEPTLLFKNQGEK